MKTLILLLFTISALAAPRGFDRRGFYLHGAWVMDYPFSVRTWQRADFARMFRLLHRLGFNTVMIWPGAENAPMPLSPEDSSVLRGYRPVIDDAHRASLECWITYCPDVIARDGIRATPWPARSLYHWMTTIHISDPASGPAYLRHRAEVLRLFDNADGFVVIDGDPGGYPGAPVSEYLRILDSDQAAVPGKLIIPWIWSGWGRLIDKAGFWKEPVAPYVRATLEALKARPGRPLEIMPGRSHREDWANGRANIEIAEQLGLIPRSTLMVYEAIEFEPTPPAAVLQFDLIRSNLRQESRLAPAARGVFGNAQQPVMVLPNLYFFARASRDLAYLERSDAGVLADLAAEVGGDAAVLVPAWSCLELPLEKLPAALPTRLRSMKLAGTLAADLPGGPARYVQILAAQVDSRRKLLAAVAREPRTGAEAAAGLSAGAAALVQWWKVHHYVAAGVGTDPFAWSFVHPSQVRLLKKYAALCSDFGPQIQQEAARQLAARGLLSESEARQRLAELASK
ncbi:MAG: hypothetical protein IT160_11380 [Bryobacterales bacterium]|nr:hypothetical protein [Bryobacterales bacterium]